MQSLKLFIVAVLLSSTAYSQETSRPADIVDLKEIDSSILVDMMYFTSANFAGEPIDGYKANVCYLTKTAAEGLKKAQARLRAMDKSLSLLVRDCYRPQKAVRHFVAWAKAPGADEMKELFFPDLTKAQLIEQNYISPVSGHSRASSIDLTIVRRTPYNEIEQVPMGTIVDLFGERSHTASTAVTKEESVNRQLLFKVMQPEFKNYAKEWWHYVLKTEPYPKTFFDFDVVRSSGERKPQWIESNEIVTQLTQPALLAELDRDAESPLSLLSLFRRLHEENKLSAPTIEKGSRSTGNLLSKYSSTYGEFAKVLKTDIDRLVMELAIDWEKDITKTYDTSAAKTATGKALRGNGNVTRILNEKWVTSEIGQFLLAGVVNRIDRRDFDTGTCGEVRFIYRLGYETQMKGDTYASRVPFTLNMVFKYKDDGSGCRDVASLWRMELVKDEQPAIVAKRLLEGPIDFSKLIFKQMEINAQAARFPSDLENVEKRGFAGQAIYLMRIFELKNGFFKPRKLENTPDVTAIAKSPEKQKLLRDYIVKNMRAIDTGAYVMPDELLTDVVLSYSTLGSSRIANKPFDLLIKPSEADQLLTKAHLSEPMRFMNNGRGLLERLNTSTCMGCHQSSSTAGFHFLGQDRIDFGAKPADIKIALDGNRLVLPFSPHLYAELTRRASYVAALANGRTANTFRPHPSAPLATWNEGSEAKFSSAGPNMPCPTSDESAFGPLSKWSCDAKMGLTCTTLVKNSSQSAGLGQCVPLASKIYSGLSCRKSDIDDSTAKSSPAGTPLAYNVRSFLDRVTKDEQFYKLAEGTLDAKQYNCRPTRIGVPLGRVTKACSPAQMGLKGETFETTPDEMCAVVGGKGFEEMARGYFNSRRFAEGVGRGILNTCSPTRFCREDYICQEMPDFLTGSRFNVSAETIKTLRQKKIGFCTPTYFVYQLRLDGHPNP